jgi:hypothetical protein
MLQATLLSRNGVLQQDCGLGAQGQNQAKRNRKADGVDLYTPYLQTVSTMSHMYNRAQRLSGCFIAAFSCRDEPSS